MTLWRISNRCDLAGWGGERADGRWHTAEHGKRVVYLSEHPALALVEVLVNLKGKPELLPDSYQLIKVNVPETLMRPGVTLPLAWRESLPATQTAGNTWLRDASSALLSVPSIPVPESTNYLLNPAHPEARLVKVEWCRWIRYDARLFQMHG